MNTVNQEQGTPGGENDPDSSLIRHYHACTGEMDKDNTIKGFEQETFPMRSCTMALGLGKNWKRVWNVIHMGQEDPSWICQMRGCCGQGGKSGLAILFMEKKRKYGINSIDAIKKAN